MRKNDEQVNRRIAQGPFASLARAVQEQRQTVLPLLQSPDERRLTALGVKIQALVEEAKHIPGASFVWAHLVDAVEATKPRQQRRRKDLE